MTGDKRKGKAVAEPKKKKMKDRMATREGGGSE
jgi:hypothetical protein